MTEEQAPYNKVEVKLPTISPSGYTSFTHCRQSWYYGYLADPSKIWPGIPATGLGIGLKPKHLPFPIKLGAIWDDFQNAFYAGAVFRPDDLMALCDHYDLDDNSTAKMFGIIKAWKRLKFNIDITNATPQAEFHLEHPTGFRFHGILDVLYPDHIVENKFSGSPKRFQKVWNFHDQAAIYFLAHPDATHIIIRAVQNPQLRPKRFEDSATFRDRIADDIISRPSHYFLGYKRETRTFGIKFWRKEFDIDGLVKDFEHVHRDMEACRADPTLCYPDKLSCSVPGTCMHLPICESGGVSDELYEPRNKPKPKQ